MIFMTHATLSEIYRSSNLCHAALPGVLRLPLSPRYELQTPFFLRRGDAGMVDHRRRPEGLSGVCRYPVQRAVPAYCRLLPSSPFPRITALPATPAPCVVPWVPCWATSSSNGYPVYIYLLPSFVRGASVEVYDHFLRKFYYPFTVILRQCVMRALSSSQHAGAVSTGWVSAPTGPCSNATDTRPLRG